MGRDVLSKTQEDLFYMGIFYKISHGSSHAYLRSYLKTERWSLIGRNYEIQRILCNVPLEW